MSAADLVIWGVVVHLVVDWLGQNDWMAMHKASLRHPAGYVHAGLHGAAQLLVFPWWAALAIGVAHLLIDTRVPVAWWSRRIGQTQPAGYQAMAARGEERSMEMWKHFHAPLFDIGAEVRIWADQVWHIAVVALVALAVTA